MRTILSGTVEQNSTVLSRQQGYHILSIGEIISNTTKSGQREYHNLTLIMKFFLSMALVFLSACNPEEWQAVDCSECYVQEPVEAEIKVRLSVRDENNHTVVNIYRGRIDEGILVVSETVRSETWRITLPVNEYYSVAAEYPSSYTTRSYQNIYAIDGGYVRTKKIYTTCDVPCWVIRGNNFDVRLKY